MIGKPNSVIPMFLYLYGWIYQYEVDPQWKSPKIYSSTITVSLFGKSIGHAALNGLVGVGKLIVVKIGAKYIRIGRTLGMLPE